MAERAAKQLELNKSELPNSITEVIATLSRAGFDAYIVGGGVRDTLLGLRPKDFDAVTDAKPHEIKDVFGKRCRIIGRRFQLAHVYSGRELIEVATFRGPPTNDSNTNQDGMILRDNVWGDIKQDFARRDFSINALYYQPLKGVVHDFCGALDDIDNKVIRLLGHAPVRVEEDPVRLLRALRFKAKLGFEFDKELSQQFHDDNWALLEQISPHRLYDETQKMFTGGYLVPLLPLLFESGAIDSLVIYPPSEPSPLVQQVAINTDKRIASGKSINPAFFYAALLWENYLHQLEKAKNRNMPFAEAQMHAAGKVIDRQRIKTAIPKFAEQFIRDIWILQPKLAAPRSKQIEQLSEHPRFRAGFDFLLLREQCGDAEHPLSESTNGMGEWWQTYQTLSERDKQQAIDAFDENIRRGAYKRERNRQKQMNKDDMQAIPQQGQTKQTMNDASNVPSKRRRRNSDNSPQVEPDSDYQTQTQTKNHSKQAVHQQSGNNKTSEKQRSNQDSNELAQLQQLSLASSDQADNKRAKSHSKATPAPLFVIGHDRVVPPLKKQLDNGKAIKPKGRKVSADNKAAIDSKAPIDSKATIDNQRQLKETRSKGDADHQDKNLPAKPKRQVNKQDGNQSSAHESDGNLVVRTPAQTPKMVTTNNEPIPYKRRRRQPSVTAQMPTETSVAENAERKKTLNDVKANDVKANNTVADDKQQSNAKSTSKPLAQPKKTANAAKKAKSEKSPPIDNGMMSNQGPIPAKRRRRQPSTDNL